MILDLERRHRVREVVNVHVFLRTRVCGIYFGWRRHRSTRDITLKLAVLSFCVFLARGSRRREGVLAHLSLRDVVGGLGRTLREIEILLFLGFKRRELLGRERACCRFGHDTRLLN